ncbi:translation initiation factor 2, partial [Lactococcus lactis subsp. lactis]|nr:translation initiation factor 2 [Lactococcus lactis subsp. lactis]
AVVQITMKNALGTHVENYQFTIEKQKQSYFATDFKHTLPEGKKE